MSVYFIKTDNYCRHQGHSWQPVGPKVAVLEKASCIPQLSGIASPNTSFPIAQFMQCVNCGAVGAYCGSDKIKVLRV